MIGVLRNAWEMIGRRLGLPCDCKARPEFVERNAEGEMIMTVADETTILVYFCPFCGRRV